MPLPERDDSDFALSPTQLIKQKEFETLADTVPFYDLALKDVLSRARADADQIWSEPDRAIRRFEGALGNYPARTLFNMITQPGNYGDLRKGEDGKYAEARAIAKEVPGQILWDLLTGMERTLKLAAAEKAKAE